MNDSFYTAEELRDQAQQRATTHVAELNLPDYLLSQQMKERLTTTYVTAFLEGCIVTNEQFLVPA